MEDKDLMEGELLTIKNACDLYLHGTLESTTMDVHTVFKDALNEALNIQNKIYNLMAERGWYTSDSADQNKVDQAKQNYMAQ